MPDRGKTARRKSGRTPVSSEALIPAAEPGPSPQFLQEDDTLLERSRVYWQTGEWGKLAALADENLESYPDRAKLSLLAAVGFSQSGDMSRARRHARLAQDWGCDRELLARVLIGGVYNSLGRAASLQGDEASAQGHFEASVGMVSPRSDTKVLGRARNLHEKVRLGLPLEVEGLFRGEQETQQANSKAGSGPPIPQEALQQIKHLEALVGVQVNAALEYPDEILRQKIEKMIVETCSESGDFYEAFEAAADSLRPVERCYLYMALSEHFLSEKNHLMAVDSVVAAEEFLPLGLSPLRIRLSQVYLRLGHPWLALQVMMSGLLAVKGRFSEKQQQALRQALRRGEATGAEHGHMLLLKYLEATPAKPLQDGRKRVLIEVGTTRERIPGQGSTLKIARLCRDQGIHMITVDMDPRNSALARKGFAGLGLSFEAVTDRGEDFLARYEKPIDFVFLDAYDFDHGMHSNLRQSRYEAFLGSRIDEEECHKMHLKCAQAIVPRLAPDGLICVDDTWLNDEGKWTAKGTLAVPFLLESGFEIVSTANRAVLMRRASAEDNSP